MKTQNESPGSRGGWVLALAPVGVALALFTPVSGAFGPGAGAHWLAPSQLGPVLALILAAAGFWMFRHRFWPRGHHECRRLRNGAVLLVLQSILLRLALELGERGGLPTWTWWPRGAWLWSPWFLTTGLAVMLLGSRFGVLLSLSGVFLLYLRADPGPLPLVGCFVSGLAGIVLLQRANRGHLLRAGAATGLLLGLVGQIEAFQAGDVVPAFAGAFLIPLGIGVGSAFSILAILPVLEWALGELSDLSLAEYGSNHPLLDQLKEQAAGTWHHSLNVSDLAEKAAMAIGARALLCKTAALYHDIGKLKEPRIFAENIIGPSPHDELDPRVSAARIIDHVTYGLELARKHRLPKVFREIIAEHHGTSVVRFFFGKVCAQLPEGEDPESIRAQFTYPGPPPSSRESGIIALADIVEAATRSLDALVEKDARSVVHKLIADRMAEGELAQCPLTLAELAQIEGTFAVWVKARHHNRPAYPQLAPLAQGKASEWPKPEGAAQPA